MHQGFSRAREHLPRAAPTHGELDGVSRRIAPGERAAQPPVQGLVNQDAHGSNRLQHLELGRLNHRDDLCPLHGRKTIQKILDGLATFQVINQVLKRDACADKDRRASHDFRIGMNHAFEICRLDAPKIPALQPDYLYIFKEPDLRARVNDPPSPSLAWRARPVSDR